MCLIKLVVLYFAVLPPPLKTFCLQTLQTAEELVGVASVKYFHTADPLAPSVLLTVNSTLPVCDTRAADE